MTSPLMPRDVAVARPLIRLSEGAALIGVHPQTLRRWVAQGKLTGWRLASNQIRVDRDELLGLVKPMTVTETAAALADREVVA
ncbi:helix-turn-helix domain-containing protein [Nocardia xishanensis]